MCFGYPECFFCKFVDRGQNRHACIYRPGAHQAGGPASGIKDRFLSALQPFSKT